MASLNEIQERTFLVGLALEHISDTELTKPRADDGGPPAGDHDNIDPRGEPAS